MDTIIELHGNRCRAARQEAKDGGAEGECRCAVGFVRWVRWTRRLCMEEGTMSK